MYQKKDENLKIYLNFNPTHDGEFHLFKAFETLISSKEILEYFEKLKPKEIKKNGKSNK